jgi:AraC-like DNA-binding protein
MNYFNGLDIITHNHLPRCSAQIDRTFTKYALNFCGGGRIRWAVNGGSPRTLTAPVAWWVWPGPCFKYGNLPGETWDHYYVSFDGPRARQMAEKGLISCSPSYPPQTIISDPEAFRAAFEQMHFVLETDQRSVQAVHLLEGLFLQLCLQPPLPSTLQTSHATKLARFVSAIRARPGVAWNFEDMAHDVGLSYAHFRRLFKHAYRLAPQKFVIKTRMDAAARLLRTSANPIKQVAETVGYDDVFHFTKQFKQTYCLSPGNYRRQSQLLV